MLYLCRHQEVSLHMRKTTDLPQMAFVKSIGSIARA